MKKSIAFLVLLVFLIQISTFSSASITEVEERVDNLFVSIATNASFDVEHLSISPEICDVGCQQVDIEFYSYSEAEGTFDILLLPDTTGDYNLRINISDDTTYEHFTRNITLERSFTWDGDDQGYAIINRLFSEKAFLVIVLILVLLFLFLLYKHQDFVLSVIRSWNIVPLVFLLISLILVSTITHQLFRMTVLESYSCDYSLEYRSFLRLASVRIDECALTESQTVFFLLSGLLGNFLIFVMLILCFLRYDRLKDMDYLAFTYGFLIYVSLYFFRTTGDIHSLHNILNWTSPQMFLNIIGFLMLFVSVSTFKEFRKLVIDK